MLRIIVVDDHTLVRQALAQTLDAEDDFSVVAQAENGEAALRLVHEHQPDLVLMDINMPDVSGVEVTQQITETLPDVKVLMLTMYRQDEFVFEAIKAGASGYLLKDVDMSQLMDAIRIVGRGEAIIDPAIASRVLDVFRNPPSLADTDTVETENLTDTEVKILKLLAQGLTNAEIAIQLDLSEKTIRNRLSVIYQKLQINNRTEAALYTLREGLATLDDEESSE